MSKKILVVDDSKTALMMEREILEKRTTYVCVTAADGREAVEKAQQEHPDLILMDVVMPRMNGFEACQMMRQQPGTREIPIVLVILHRAIGVSHQDRQDWYAFAGRQPRQFGGNCTPVFLIKPVDPSG